jgi:hypothetical protein
MQNNDNQTNQKDPQNRGQNGFEYISPGLCSIWLGIVDVFQEEIESFNSKMLHLPQLELSIKSV